MKTNVKIRTSWGVHEFTVNKSLIGDIAIGAELMTQIVGIELIHEDEQHLTASEGLEGRGHLKSLDADIFAMHDRAMTSHPHAMRVRIIPHETLLRTGEIAINAGSDLIRHLEELVFEQKEDMEDGSGMKTVDVGSCRFCQERVGKSGRYDWYAVRKANEIDRLVEFHDKLLMAFPNDGSILLLAKEGGHQTHSQYLDKDLIAFLDEQAIKSSEEGVRKAARRVGFHGRIFERHAGNGKASWFALKTQEESVSKKELIALHDEITTKSKTAWVIKNVRLYTATTEPVPVRGLKVAQRYINTLDKLSENIIPHYDRDMPAPDGTMGAYVRTITFSGHDGSARTFEQRLASTGGNNPPSVWLVVL